ncbi:MAG: fructose-bisphosphate aldolase, partial [Cyanobacteria bacterium J06638_6]
MVTALSSPATIAEWLGPEAESLLTYEAKVPKSMLHLPGPDWVDRSFAQSDRSPQVLRSLQQLYGTGRLANTGYLSILPVD